MQQLQALRDTKRKVVKRRPARNRRVTQAEKLVVAELVADSPSNIPNKVDIDNLAIALRRSPSTIQSIVSQARDRLVSNALAYVDLHKDAADKALAIGDLGEARKAAEWAIEHISSRDADGKVESIVERIESESNAPRIQIGIALGGIPIKDK